MSTSRVMMSRNVTWLKYMFFKDTTSGIINLDTLDNQDSELGPTLTLGLGTKDDYDITSTGPTDNQHDMPGSSVMWRDPAVTRPGAVYMTQTGCTIKPPDKLMYAQAVELKYLGEMAELDHVELAKMYLSL